MRHQRCGEEVPGCTDVSPLRDIDIDDLAVLIYGSVHVPPNSGDFHIGLVYEPPISDTVAAGSRCVDELWGEALYPAVDGDVINLDAAFSKEFLHIAVRQAVSEVPADSQQDHFGWEPVPGERIGLNTAATVHRHTLAEPGRSVNATVPLMDRTGPAARSSLGRSDVGVKEVRIWWMARSCSGLPSVSGRRLST